jgi:mono/diheme cytochrome c family protein
MQAPILRNRDGVWLSLPVLLRIVATLLAMWFTPGIAQSGATPVLVLTDPQGKSTQLTAERLLARPDNTVIDIHGAGDIYRHAVRYHAVPLLALLALLGSLTTDQFDTLQAEASDGFVSQIPLSLIARGANGGSVAWVAVEDPAHPWPALPNARESAGPFYLVWDHPERSGIGREQWPYRVTKLTLVAGPLRRWPQLAVAGAVPPDAPARRGQNVFIFNCIHCHRMKGGGASTTGPDLGLPMAVTRYLSDFGLRAIIRDPASVRSWPEQHMIGFSKTALSDADLDALVAYLHAMSEPAAAAP